MDTDKCVLDVTIPLETVIEEASTIPRAIQEYLQLLVKCDSIGDEIGVDQTRENCGKIETPDSFYKISSISVSSLSL